MVNNYIAKQTVPKHHDAGEFLDWLYGRVQNVHIMSNERFDLLMENRFNEN